MLWTNIVFFLFLFNIQNNICTQHVLNLYFLGNSINNLSSYSWLTYSRMRASDTELHVFKTNLNFSYQWIIKGPFVISIIKVDIRVPLFFRFSLLKLKFVSDKIWTKILKSSHCGMMGQDPCLNYMLNVNMTWRFWSF